MQNASPVFLFAFANDAQDRLQLDDEWRALEKALQHANDAGRLTFNLTPSANKEDIFEKFNRFHDRVALFHYGGHSGPDSLALVDEDFQGQSLATVIGQEKNLKLVFLNGCSNAGQVEELFEKGVPAVIATTEPINDVRAVKLAKQFYTALAAGRTIKEAFEMASAFVNNNEQEVLVEYRTLVMVGAEKKAFEWGLYVNDPSVLKWSIPEVKQGEQPGGSSKIFNQTAEKI